MTRNPKPDPVPYLRLILGMPTDKKILSIHNQNRLDLAVELVTFISKHSPRKPAMAAFLNNYIKDYGLSRSLCYKVKARLEQLTIIRWDDYWREYRLNMERWKRDRKALRAFKTQIKAWTKKAETK